jgi:hypothetical protein
MRAKKSPDQFEMMGENALKRINMLRQISRPMVKGIEPSSSAWKVTNQSLIS